MDFLNEFFLWAQQQQQQPQGGGANWGFVVFVIIYIIFVFLRSLGQAKNQPTEKSAPKEKKPQQKSSLEEAFTEASTEIKSKRKRRRDAEATSTSTPLPDSESQQPTRHRALARELNPQGEGIRFEARPGTLDGSQIVAPSVEPTVKPNLDSLTGVFEVHQEDQGHQTSINLQQLITTPDGIRQAIILAEIMKRPDF